MEVKVSSTVQATYGLELQEPVTGYSLLPTSILSLAKSSLALNSREGRVRPILVGRASGCQAVSTLFSQLNVT